MRVARLLARLWPNGLAGQFAVLLIAALVAANVVAVGVLSSERARITREVRRGAEIERFVTLAGALAQVPPAQRPALARATSSPFLRLSVDPAPTVAADGTGRVEALLGGLVAAELDEAGLVGADVRVRVEPHPAHPPAGPPHRHADGHGHDDRWDRSVRDGRDGGDGGGDRRAGDGGGYLRAGDGGGYRRGGDGGGGGRGDGERSGNERGGSKPGGGERGDGERGGGSKPGGDDRSGDDRGGDDRGSDNRGGGERGGGERGGGERDGGKPGGDDRSGDGYERGGQERGGGKAGRGDDYGGRDGDEGGRRWRLVDAFDLSLGLPDGAWVNARVRRPEGPPGELGRAVVLPLALSLLAVLTVGVTFIRRLTRPVRALAEAAERAGAGDRSATVPVAGAGEVRRAAEAFNRMQTRIARFDAERARTVAAIGHDLRTPITSLRIRAEMLDDEARDAMVRTLDEMRVMADGLLEYGRAGAEAEGRVPLDLAALLRTLAGDGIVYEGPDSLAITGRPVALRRAIGNLVENARRYAGDAVLRLVAERGTAVITVEDRGPGIPDDRLADVTEPFVRLEGSRSGDTGGAGLGLAIARTLLSAHGGTLTLANRAGGGLVVTVRLPLG